MHIETDKIFSFARMTNNQSRHLLDFNQVLMKYIKPRGIGIDEVRETLLDALIKLEDSINET